MKNFFTNTGYTPGKINFDILDGLRGIAATYVVFNHARGNLFIGGAKYSLIKDPQSWSLWEKIYFSIAQVTSLGREFVILFFIISGFSIAYSLNRKPTLGDFYLRRLIRIYPPYIFSLIWAYAIFQVMNSYSPNALKPEAYSVFANWEACIKNLLYVDNGSLIIQFWSLKYEVIFYLLVPFFMYKSNIYLVASFIIATVSAVINLKDPSAESTLGQYVLDFNIYFAIGVLCFHYYKIISPVFIFKNKKQFYIAAIILFLAMVGYRVLSSDGRTKFSLIIASVFSIVLLFNFLHYNIQTKMLGFLGKISYSTYISHFASLMLLLIILLKTGVIDSPEIQNKYIWLLGIPFSIIFSYLFYLLIEKQTKGLLEKLRSKKNKNIS